METVVDLKGFITIRSPYYNNRDDRKPMSLDDHLYSLVNRKSYDTRFLTHRREINNYIYLHKQQKKNNIKHTHTTYIEYTESLFVNICRRKLLKMQSTDMKLETDNLARGVPNKTTFFSYRRPDLFYYTITAAITFCRIGYQIIINFSGTAVVSLRFYVPHNSSGNNALQ